MATGGTKMSFNNYQNGKYGAMAGPGNASKDMEVTQDMHLKMSKKIAQLTKVIYALNTKNDEHDGIVQSLKEQHEEQMAQLMGETQAKLETYRQRIAAEVDQKRSIQVLQDALQDQQRHREDATTQLQEFKRKAEEREMELKTSHSKQLLDMSQDVLQIKKDFESKLQMIDTLKKTYEDEKERAIEDLKAQYVEEVEKIRKEQDSKQSDLSSEREQLAGKYQREIEELNQNCAGLKLERDKLTEDYELKLSKAQAFYEKELEVLKQASQAGFEEKFLLLQEEQEKLKKDFKFQEGELKKRIDGLVSELSQREEEVEKTKQQLEDLQAHINHKNADSEFITNQLNAAKKEANDAVTRLKEVEAELAGSRERCEHQAAELLRKSTNVGELEATRLQQQSTIKDLTNQVGQLQDKIRWLESSKKSLADKSQSLEHEQGSQLRSLERALEELSIEKQTLIEKYDREMAALKEKSHQREQELINDHLSKMTGNQRDLERELEKERQNSEEKLKQLRESLEQQLSSTREELERSRQALADEYEQVKADLTAKLQQAQDEVKRLSDIVQQSEQGLGSASDQIQGLTEAAEKLRNQLNAAQSELRSAKNKSTSLEGELEKLRLVHEQKVKEAAQDLKDKLDQLSVDLDIKWTETLRSELSKQRKELTSQKEEDKRAALEHLTSLKDKEIAAERLGWQNKLQELLSQISDLKSKLDAAETAQGEELSRIQSEAESENRRLRQELLDAAEQYASKIDSLEKMYSTQLQALRETKEQEAKDIEERLRQRHIEDMKAQMMAHKATLQTVKDSSEQAKEADLQALAEEHDKQTDSLQLEMQHRHAEDMEEASRSHQMELAAARMELDRAIEVARQKDGEYAMQISDLNDDIRAKESSLKRLEAEINSLQKGIHEMSHELEFKGKEILRTRSEANVTLRAKEESLQQQFAESISQLHMEHTNEKQEMLGEFTQAQDLLKDKIAAMQIMLEEAEERYRSRESRPEDLEMIERLQEAIAEREAALKKLLDEKRYYQMELVNRETNFNKVFNSSPNVGVLNPFQVKKPKGDRAAARFNSSPSLGTVGSGGRLDPLPGSPLHDEKINNNRPLPPAPRKKFVK